MILKGLFRRKTRTVLTTAGVSIALASIVVFTSIALGLKKSMEDYGRQTGADIIMTQSFIADIGFGSFPKEIIDKLLSKEEISSVDGSLFSLVLMTSPSQKTRPVLAIGREINGELLRNLSSKITQGTTILNPDEAIVGKIMAEEFKLKLNDTISLSKHLGKSALESLIHSTSYTSFKITGIFQTNIAWEDGSCIVDAKIVRDQRKMADGSFNVGFIFLKEKYKKDTDKIIKELGNEFPDYSILTIDRITELIKYQMEVVDKVIFIVVIMSLILGTIGILNTLLMNITERKKEIGVMLSFGWTRIMILKLFIIEGFIMSIVGAITGSIIGTILTETLINYLSIGLQSNYDLAMFIKIFILAIFIGTIGALYPAYKASLINPAEILRNE